MGEQMYVLTRWLADLAATIDGQGQLTASHHRVVHPRGLPLNGAGLVRHQAISPLERPGLPPEYLSLMSFFVTGDKQYGVQQGDLARALGALITFVLDRRVDDRSRDQVAHLRRRHRS